MSTPDVPRRLELTFEMPGTPEEVWAAIATADGLSSWFLPTDLEERIGGSIVTHMGPEFESPGVVTGWDPPRRLTYEEPNWAALAGREGAPVTPLATEFIVEAQSGGSCVVRVVSSAFGTGADWEGEFFDEMEKGWTPYFDRLRLYLTHFAGQRAAVLEVQGDVPAELGQVWTTMRRRLDVSDAGESFEVRDLKGTVERVGEADLLVSLTEPVAGFLAVSVGAFDGRTVAMVHGQLFADDAAAFVERERPVWEQWVATLATSTT
ncbi:MAG: SRPBCC family protein [Acidimicrobiales bacterium]